MGSGRRPNPPGKNLEVKRTARFSPEQSAKIDYALALLNARTMRRHRCSDVMRELVNTWADEVIAAAPPEAFRAAAPTLTVAEPPAHEQLELEVAHG